MNGVKQVETTSKSIGPDYNGNDRTRTTYIVDGVTVATVMETDFTARAVVRYFRVDGTFITAERNTVAAAYRAAMNHSLAIVATFL